MLLEGHVAAVVATKVIEELLHRIPKCLVLRVLVELIAKELKLIKNTIGMIPVALTQEVTAMVSELVPLAIAIIIHNIALLG